MFYWLKSRLKTALWYLRRPHQYPQLCRQLASRFGGGAEQDTSQEALSWCEGCAISTSEALSHFTGKASFKTLRELEPDILDRAELLLQQCPVKMPAGGGNVDLLYWIAEFLQARVVIETGVAYGWSSLALLLSLQKRPGSYLVSTDMPVPWLDSDCYVGYVVPDHLRSCWRIIRQADREALAKAFKYCNSIDLCHYDSDKSYAGRMWAYPKLWDKLCKGGIFISDDVNDDLAFRDFANQVNVKAVVVRTPDLPKGSVKYVGILSK